MAQPQKTPEEGKEIETWQYSNITEAIFGDHTRIHQGNVINISGSENSHMRRHFYPQYGNVRGGIASKEHNEAGSSDREWLEELFDMTLRESRRAEAALGQCCIEDHDNDELLDGFVYNRVMQSWFSSRGSILCCWLDITRPADHTRVAKCILCKVLSSKTDGVNHIFLYDHYEGTAVELPESYLDAKAKALKTKTDKPWKAAEESLDTKEIVLLSFAMQAKAKGFAIPLEEIDFSGPIQLIDSLIILLVEALHSVDGRVFLVLEWPGSIESAAEASETLDIINGLLSKSRNKSLSHKCSVIMSVRETPVFLSLLKGHPSVRADSEYKECLDSLQLKRGNLRRDEIARPVLSSNLWIWDHPSLKRLMISNSGALAIIGKAGCGKSVLAKTIQEGVSQNWNRLGQSSNNRKLLVSDWFYCRRRGDIYTAYSSLLRNVLAQLLLKETSLLDHCKSLYRHKLSSRLQEWANEELEQIIEKINMSGLSILMVFDGIDEAKDDRMVSFVETLVSRPGSSIKAVLLSRQTDAFEKPFWEARRVTLQDENTEDVHLVVKHGLSKLLSIMNGQYKDPERELPAYGDYPKRGPIKFRTHAALRQTHRSSPRPAAPSFVSRQSGSSLDLDVLGENIRERAAGVILWVVLVFDSLFKFVKREPVVTIKSLMSCTTELPRDIDAFYSQMINDLAVSISPSAQGIARQALIWINTASQFKAFTMEELWDALAASSQKLNDPGNGSSRQTLIDERIEIQSWKNFNRILRQLCGSLIEILPLKSATSTGSSDKDTDADSRAMSGKCVVQLMHQTVKDFLTSSSAARDFSFTEKSAQDEVILGCQNFIRFALPDDIDSIIPLPRERPQDWVFFSADMARYLEEFRLFPLCLQLLNAFPESMGAVQTQSDMKWYGLLPRWLHDTHHLDLVQGWKYDFAELTLTASALGLMFQFISRRGLRDAAENLLSVLDMGTTTVFWPKYRGVILNALAFAVFDLEESHDSEELRARLLTPGGVRRESADLALNNYYYETTTCGNLFNDDESAEEVPLNDSVETIEFVLNYNAGVQWGLEAYGIGKRNTRKGDSKSEARSRDGQGQRFVNLRRKISEARRRKTSVARRSV